MKNEIIARFLEFHAGSDDKLSINFAWPYNNVIVRGIQACKSI